MITLALLCVAALWIVALHQYPSFFIPRRSTGLARGPRDLGENWIEVLPNHREDASLQEAS